MRKRILTAILAYTITAALPLYVTARLSSDRELFVLSDTKSIISNATNTSSITSKSETSSNNPEDKKTSKVSVSDNSKVDDETSVDLKGIKKYKEFKIKDTSTNEIISVKDKDFIIGGTAAEVPSTFQPEAIKAQMVAVYTYYSRQRQNNREGDNLDYDFSADLSIGEKYLTDELFKERTGDNYNNVIKVYKDAAEEVYGELVEYDGEAALTVFYAISGGVTEKSENVFVQALPYLTDVASPYDTEAPGYKTEEYFTADEAREIIEANFPDANLGENPFDWLEITERTSSGTVMQMSIGQGEYTGLEVRNAFSLRSSDFDVVYSEENFVFTVRGYGHNVGLSQYGAEFMAQQGATYKEILSHYYPGTSIVEV
ncbi:MAG: SpoIID/LytB domain-containing protein [Clostridia bacterium]|nr:SpoIID/LytB domain-containing protein [Clostridia bacterium]